MYETMLTYFFNKNNYRLSNGLQLPQSTVENIDKCFLNNTIYATFFFFHIIIIVEKN